ncbi:MAG: AMIN domain-containing protein [Desulfobacterales bacterium]
MKITAIVLTAFLLVFGAGCPSNHSTVEIASVPKRINEIRVDEDDKFWYCDIKSDESLSFTAFNQVAPAGLLLYFPDTALDFEQTILFPPSSDMFKSIEADEVMDGDTKSARLRIVMQVERPYAFSPDQNGVRISFPKTTHRPADTDNTIHSPAGENEMGAAEKDLSAATVLETVSATALKNHIIINVNADGTIADYKSFAIENPARIVFDIYNLKSPYEKEQIISVTSEWVMQIRYFAYPDKIRLVLDTKPEFLSQYFSFPTADGLLIYVGRIPEPLAERGPISEAGR